MRVYPFCTALFAAAILNACPTAQAFDAVNVDHDVAQKAAEAVVVVSVTTEGQKYSLTGFFVSEDGLVMTSACSLEGAKK